MISKRYYDSYYQSIMYSILYEFFYTTLIIFEFNFTYLFSFSVNWTYLTNTFFEFLISLFNYCSLWACPYNYQSEIFSKVVRSILILPQFFLNVNFHQSAKFGEIAEYRKKEFIFNAYLCRWKMLENLLIQFLNFILLLEKTC